MTGQIDVEPFARPALPVDGYATHEVMNQASPLVGHNAFTDDRLLTEIAGNARDRHGPATASPRPARRWRARAWPSWRTRPTGTRPSCSSHDRFGHRIDEIAFHPAWHELMSLAIGHGTHALAWTASRSGAHVARGMLSYLWNQGESGICCPLGMTYSAVPALRLQPDLAAVWEPFILSTRYDASAAPDAAQDRRHRRHDTDREAGGLRPACDRDHRAPRRYAARAGRGLPGSTATSGSSRSRTATSSSPWRAPTAACRASCCRAGCPTGRATAC